MERWTVRRYDLLLCVTCTLQRWSGICFSCTTRAELSAAASRSAGSPRADVSLITSPFCQKIRVCSHFCSPLEQENGLGSVVLGAGVTKDEQRESLWTWSWVWPWFCFHFSTPGFLVRCEIINIFLTEDDKRKEQKLHLQLSYRNKSR